PSEPPTMPPRDPDEPPRQQRTLPIVSAAPAARDARELVVTYRLPSPCAPGLHHVGVDETPAKVVLTLHREAPDPKGGEVCAQVIVERSTRVRLAEPLGDRVVIDGTTGKPVPG